MGAHILKGKNESTMIHYDYANVSYVISDFKIHTSREDLKFHCHIIENFHYYIIHMTVCLYAV